MDRASCYSAGFFVTRRVPAPIWSGVATLLPQTIVSASSCLCRFLPDSWAIEWCKCERREREEAARTFGVQPDRLDSVIENVTRLVADEASYGFPNLCYTLEAAQTAIQLVCPGAQDLGIFELGLPKDRLEEFCLATTPPPSRPGYAPNGEAGVLTALRRRIGLLESGVELGFEPLVFNFSLSCSWLCNGFEKVIAEKLGIRPNRHGLLGDLASADRAVAYMADETVSGEDGLWLPWLIVEHDALVAR